MFSLARDADGGAGKAPAGPGAKERPAPIRLAGDLVRFLRGILMETWDIYRNKFKFTLDFFHINEIYLERF